MSIPYKNVLIPLDGSKTAESAIADAVAVAEATAANLVLLSVVPPISDLLPIEPHPLFIDEQFDARRAAAIRYLDGIRHRIGGRSLSVKVDAEMGPPADTILAYARSHEIDLVVMATHGHSGVKKWLIGSVANKVVQGADVPVLLVRGK